MIIGWKQEPCRFLFNPYIQKHEYSSALWELSFRLKVFQESGKVHVLLKLSQVEYIVICM